MRFVRWSRNYCASAKRQARSEYRLQIEFEDGVRGILDLSNELYGPVFEPLRDRAFFEQVRIDEYGIVCWPNGADLAPEVIHEEFLAAAHPESTERLTG